MEFYKIILGFQALTVIVAMVILIWLALRRIKKKKEETFEKRNN